MGKKIDKSNIDLICVEKNKIITHNKVNIKYKGKNKWHNQ